MVKHYFETIETLKRNPYILSKMFILSFNELVRSVHLLELYFVT